MTRSPNDGWMGPEGSQLSNQRKIFLPLPTIYLMKGRYIERSWRTLRHVQELLVGMGMSQSEWPRRRFARAHITQVEDGKGWLRCHKCFPIVATFHSANFLMPSPPSFKGKVRSSQATLAPPGSSWDPFHKKRLKICSTWWITFFGRIKRPF